MSDLYYSLAPGLEIVPLEGDRYQLRSDFAALELSGETAVELVEKVLSDLEQPLELAEILARLPGYRAESLHQQLDNFVSAGVLVASREETAWANPTFAALLDEAGFGAEETLARLAQSRVGIFGLEAHGAHVAQLLADSGVGELVLVDPFLFEAAHHALTPVRAVNAVGARREDAVATLVARSGLEVTTSGGDDLDRDRIHELASGCRLLIACWDRGFQAAMHWVNHAAIDLCVPALFSELRATSCFAGPLLLPDRSACWMCYRMRALAAERDFDLAMAYEEHLDQARRPRLASRPVLPALPQHLASMLSLEALKLLIRLNQPTLVDKVLTLDGLTSETRSHPVLVKPYCPTCSKKNPAGSPVARSSAPPQPGPDAPPSTS